ncbi:MAG: flagellar filament capping protein FliD [Pyrinomonadaceae bacterium]
MTSSTNTFSGAVAGVSLDVLSLGAASVTITGSPKSGTDDIRALLTGASGTQTGLANSIYTTMNGLSDNINGVVQTAINSYQQSIKNIDKSISAQFDRLNLLRQSLTRQFAVADAAIGQLNGQGTTLDGVIKSLQPRAN